MYFLSDEVRCSENGFNSQAKLQRQRHAPNGFHYAQPPGDVCHGQNDNFCQHDAVHRGVKRMERARQSCNVG